MSVLLADSKQAQHPCQADARFPIQWSKHRARLVFASLFQNRGTKAADVTRSQVLSYLENAPSESQYLHTSSPRIPHAELVNRMRCGRSNIKAVSRRVGATRGDGGLGELRSLAYLYLLLPEGLGRVRLSRKRSIQDARRLASRGWNMFAFPCGCRKQPSSHAKHVRSRERGPHPTRPAAAWCHSRDKLILPVDGWATPLGCRPTPDPAGNPGLSPPKPPTHPCLEVPRLSRGETGIQVRPGSLETPLLLPASNREGSLTAQSPPSTNNTSTEESKLQDLDHDAPTQLVGRGDKIGGRSDSEKKQALASIANTPIHSSTPYYYVGEKLFKNPPRSTPSIPFRYEASSQITPSPRRAR